MKIKKLFIAVVVLTIAISSALLWGISVRGQQAGTTLSASKTANGFWEIVYDWTLEKTVEPNEIELAPLETGTVTYTITATRNQVSEKIGVRGEITVTNGGERATEGLKIVDRVQYKNPPARTTWTDYVSEEVDISAKPVLGPGESYSYPYEIEFTPIPGATYRNAVKVTITNHSGHLGEEFGPEPKADFTLPSSPTLIDEEASVDDIQIIPTGFETTASQTFPVNLTDSSSIQFTKNITNISAGEGTYYLNNTATLEENDTKETRTDLATVTIIVPKKAEVLEGLSLGFWKNHPNMWQGYSTNTPIKDVFSGTNSTPYSGLGNKTLLEGLSFRGGNTLEGAAQILLRQAIAAVLNAAHSNINYPLSTTDVISQVNSALDSKNRATILNLANTLDGYNNLGGDINL